MRTSRESFHRLSGPASFLSITGIVVVNALALSLALAGPAWAGAVAPSVRTELAALPPGGQATALFMMAAQADIAALDRALTARRATRQERHREVVEALQTVAKESQGPFLAALAPWVARGEVTSQTPYWLANAVRIRGSRVAILSLAEHPEVAAVLPDLRAVPVETPRPGPQGAGDRGARGIGIAPGVRAIHAPRVWRELGYNGTGALVAVLDTGVDGTHPALHDRWRGNNGHPWQECWLDVLGTQTTTPNDDGVGHGTHVMGTLAGIAPATEDTIGVAWGAQWIAANAIRQGPGPAFNADIFTCLQWFADPDGNPNTVDDVPDVVQNSWGVNEALGYDDCEAMWLPFITNCEAGGTVLTWSAGGDGPGAGTIRSPADAAVSPTQCFAVGTVDATNFDFPFPIASFSSRGPSGCDVPEPLKIKPEVVAPGVNVYSSVPGAAYGVWSGSAMAGPHVAGVVALLRCADPDLEVGAIKEILMATARDEGPAGEDNTYGWGVIDAYAAVAGFGPSAAPADGGGAAAIGLTVRPNPFTGETTVRFRLPAAGPVALAIHEPGGRLVRTLLSGSLPAGEQSVVWNGRDDSGRPVPAGVYFTELRGPAVAEGRGQSPIAERRKLLLLH